MLIGEYHFFDGAGVDHAAMILQAVALEYHLVPYAVSFTTARVSVDHAMNRSFNASGSS